MPKRIIGIFIIVVLLLSFSLIIPVSAQQIITSDPYNIEFSWLNAPPIAGQANAIVMKVTLKGVSPNTVADDGVNLVLTVSTAGQSQVLTLQPQGENAPGQFIAPITPTAPGIYTASITGSIAATDDVDGDVQLDKVLPGGSAPFPPVEAAADQGGLPWTAWIGIAALVISLAALALSILAFHKRG